MSKTWGSTLIGRDLRGGKCKADSDSGTVNKDKNEVDKSSIWLYFKHKVVEVYGEDRKNGGSDQV